MELLQWACFPGLILMIARQSSGLLVDQPWDTSKRWYWSLDGPGETMSGPVATLLSGSPEVVTGIKRSAYRIDGSHTYELDPGSSCIFDATCPRGYMVSLWVNAASSGNTTGTQTILSTGADHANGTGLQISWDRSTNIVAIFAADVVQEYGTLTYGLSLDEWVHLTVLVDPNMPGIQAWANGTHLGDNMLIFNSGNTGGWIDNTDIYDKVKLGVGHSGVGHFTDSDLLVDEVHIWETDITHQQVQDLYGSSVESGITIFYLALDYVYQGNLVSGDLMRPVVSGTVNSVLGRYSGGLEFLPNSAIDLGTFSNCFEWPDPGTLTMNSWCSVEGMTLYFWLKLELYSGAPTDGLIMGNTLPGDRESGFMVYQINPSQCSIRVEFRNIDTRHWKDYSCTFGEWTRYNLGYHIIMEGGYELMVRDTKSESELNKEPQAWFNPSTEDTSSNPFSFNAGKTIHLGHPTQGAYFMIDELYMAGLIVPPRDTKNFEKNANTLQLPSSITDTSDFSPLMDQIDNQYWPYNNDRVSKLIPCDPYGNCYSDNNKYINPGAFYFNGASMVTPEGLITQAQYGSSCEFDTECKRGFSTRFWVYQGENRGDVTETYYLDTGALEMSSWGAMIRFSGGQLEVIVSTRRYEWRETFEFGFGQWIDINLEWWTYVGFRVHMGGRLIGTYTARTPRASPQSRAQGVSPSNMHIARPENRPGSLADSLAIMYFSNFYYWDVASEKIGYIDNTRMTDSANKYLWTANNTLDDLAADGSWLNGSFPLQMIGGAAQVTRNSYFGEAVRLDGVDDVVRSDNLIWQCVTNPDICNTRSYHMSFWVHPHNMLGSGSRQTILWIGTAATPVLEVYHQSGTTKVEVWNRNQLCTVTISLVDNTWTWLILYWENTGTGTSRGNRFYVYLDGVVVKQFSDQSCVNNARSVITEAMGHIMFGAGPGATQGTYINHMAMDVDDIMLKDTFGHNNDINWFDQTRYLRNLTASDLYVADSCTDYVEAEFPLLSRVRIKPHDENIFHVFCDYVQDTGLTETHVTLYTDNMNKDTNNNNGRNPDFFSSMPRYSMNMDGINALKAVSPRCKQYLKYTCPGKAKLFSSTTSSYWRDINNVKRYYWAGSDDANLGKCECYLTGSCPNCTCHGDTGGFDDGYLTDKDRLPVRSMSLEYANNQVATWEVGPLICQNIDPDGLNWPLDALDIREVVDLKHGSFVGSQTTSHIRSGTLHQAIQLDGTTSYISLDATQHACIPDIRQCIRGLSASLWVRLAEFTGRATLMSNLVKVSGTQALGWELAYQGGSLYLQVSHGPSTWSRSAYIVTGVWTHLAVTWKDDGGTALYVNGFDMSAYGSIETVTSNNPTGLTPPGVLTVGSNPGDTGGRQRLAIDDIWFSPYYVYTIGLVQDRTNVWERTYEVLFDTPPSDLLSITELRLTTSANTGLTDGVAGSALILAQDGSISSASKTLQYECLGRLDLCHADGMTFSVWLRQDVNMWTDVTSYTLINALPSGANRQGFKVTSTGRECQLVMSLLATQMTFTTEFDCPVDKWFYLSIGWEEDTAPVLHINGFLVDVAPSNVSATITVPSPPSTLLSIGWGHGDTASPPLLVDDLYFTEKIQTKSEIQSKYVLGDRRYHLNFDTISGPGDLDMTYIQDPLFSPIVIHGKSNKALYLRGRSYATTTVPFFLECLGNPDRCVKGFSISFWIFVRTTYSPGYIISAYSDIGEHGFYISYHVSGSYIYLKIRVEKGNKYYERSSVRIDANTWSHIAFTCPHSGSRRIWINGAYYQTLSSSGSMTAQPEQDVQLIFGASNHTGNITDHADMAIDEFIFQETILDDATVAARYDLGANVSDNFYWSLDGPAVQGELNGTSFPLVSQSASYSPSSAVQSAVFDGVDDSLDLGGEAGTCLTSEEFCSNFNIHFLMTFTGAEYRDQTIISTTAHDSNMTGFFFRYGNYDPRLPFRYYFKVGVKYDGKEASGLVHMEHGQTCQVHIRWDSSTVELFIDTVQALSVSGSALSEHVDNRTENSHLVVGRKWDTTAEYAKVEVDEIYAWNGALNYVQPDLSEDFYSVGCYQAVSLSPVNYYQSSMTTNWCRSRCGHVYRYVGIGSGNRCNCYNDLDDLTLIANSSCEKTCNNQPETCGSDTDSLKLSVYHTTAHLPFPNPDPILDCVAVVPGHYPSYGVVAVDVTVTFEVAVSCNQGEMIIYNYTLGDGTPYELSEINKTTHSYSTVGEYSGWVELRNEPSTEFVYFTILSIYPTTPIISLAIAGGTVPVNTPTNIYVTMTSGDHITCYITFGDGNGQAITSAAHNAIYTLPHTYTNMGPYWVNVTCNNTITDATAVNTLNVAEALTGFNIASNWVFEVDQPMSLNWTMTTGGYLFYTTEVDGISRTVGLYDTTHNLGTIVNAVGTYQGWIDVGNALSVYVNRTFTIEVARKLSSISLICPTHGKTGEDMDIDVSLVSGSGATVSTYFPLTLNTETFAGDFTSQSVSYTGSYPSPGVYTVTVTASNILVPTYYSQRSETCDINVENPVTALDLNVVEVGPFGTPLQATLSLVTMATPATNVQINVYIEREDDVTPITCHSDTSDQFTSIVTNCPITYWGWHNVTALVYNNVSSQYIDFQIPLGRPITDLQYDIVTPLIAEGQTATVKVKIVSDSGGDVEIDFGDGNTIKQPVVPNTWVTFSHMYPDFSDYTLIFNATNPSSELTRECFECLVVQEPVSGLQWDGPQLFVYGPPLHKSWTIDTGSHMKYKAYASGQEVGVSSIQSHVTGGGNVTISNQTLLSLGFQDLRVMAWNDISGPVDVTQSVQLLNAVVNLTASGPLHGATGQAVNVSYAFAEGTMVNIRIVSDFYGTTSEVSSSVIEDSPGLQHQQAIIFTVPGTYIVEVKAFNPFSEQTQNVVIFAENPIINATMELTPSLKYQEPIEVDLVVNPGLKEATHYSFHCEMGDATTSPLSFFTPMDSISYNLIRHYSCDGFYNVTCQVYNDVSQWSGAEVVQVGSPVGDVSMSAIIHIVELTDEMTLNTTISAGSNMQAEYNLGDGNRQTYSIIAQTNQLINYSYAEPGDYWVNVTVSNAFGEKLATLPSVIFIQEKIIPLQTTFIPTQTIFPRGGVISAEWNLAQGSNVSAMVYFDNILVYSSDDFPQAGNISLSAFHSSVLGTFTMTLSLSNLVTPQFNVSSTLSVLDPLAGIGISCPGDIFSIRVPVTCVVDLQNGSRVTLKVKYDDRNVPVTQYFSGGGYHNLSSVRTFSFPGLYTVTGIASGPLGHLSQDVNITLQVPVYAGFLSATQSQFSTTLVSFYFTLNPGDLAPSEPIFTFDLGGISAGSGTETSRMGPQSWMVYAQYLMEGVYTATGVATNNVSSWSTEVNVTLGTAVEGLMLNLTSAVVAAGDVVDVCFSITKGTNATVRLVADTGVTKNLPGILEPFTIECLGFRFETGYHWIKGEANNTFSYNATETPTLIVEDPVSGLYLDMPKAAVKGMAVTISVGYRTIGKDYCVLLDLDGNQTIQYVFGVERCEDDHPYYNYRAPIPGEDTFSITLNLTREETINVSAHAYNRLNSDTVYDRLLVIYCPLPKVKLNGQGKKRVFPVQFYRSEDIHLDAYVSNPCTIPWEMVMTWTIKVWPGENETLEYTMNITQPRLPSLTLSSLSFPYGLVHANLFVKVGPYDGIQDEDDKYLRIAPSPLVVHIAGNSARAVKKGNVIEVDARTGSYDPDDPDGTLNQIAYDWFVKSPSDTDWSAIAGDGYGFTRRRRAVASPGVLYVSASLPGGEYQFKVAISSGDRLAYFVQSLYLVSGDVYDVEIECKVNCGKKVTTKQQLTLTGKCVTCVDSIVTKEWNLYKIDGDTATQVNLYQKTTTGVNGLSIGIKPGTLTPGNTYKVRYTARGPGGAFGYTETLLHTHLPPYGGKCKVTPDKGVAILTTYQVICTNWKDEGLNLQRDINVDSLVAAELEYTFYQRPVGGTTEWSQLRHGPDPQTPNMYLAMGHKAHNYICEIRIIISDMYGEYVEIINSETVVAEFFLSNDDLHNRLSGDVTEFDFHMAAKDGRSLVNGVSAYTEQLDRQGDETCGVSEQKDDRDVAKRTVMRSTLVEILSNGRGLMTSLESVSQAGSALSSITQVPAELTPATKELASNLTFDMSQTLLELNGNGKEKQIHEASIAVIDCVGNLLDSSRPTSPTLEYQTDFDLPIDEKNKAIAKAKQEATLQLNNERDLARTMVTQLNKAVDNIRVASLADKMIDEDPVSFNLPGKEFQFQRHSPESTYSKSISVKGGKLNVATPGKSSGFLDGYSKSHIDSQAIYFSENIYTWDDSATSVKSGVTGLKFTDPDGTEVSVSGLKEDVDISLPLKQHSTVSEKTRIRLGKVEKRDSDLVPHNISFYFPATGIQIKLTPVKEKQKFKLFIKLDEEATKDSFDQTEILNSANDFSVMIAVPTDVKNGTYHISVQQTSRRQYEPIEYDFEVELRSCIYWNEGVEKWTGDGCRIKPHSAVSSTSVTCSCNHLTFFGGDYFVAPNTIDFDTVWGKFADIGENLSVMCTVIGLIVLYWIGALLLRRMDLKDREKWLVRPLLDNSPTDTHRYVLSVVTGGRRGAGTTSNVSFIVVGDKADSDVRALNDGYRKELKRGSTNHYFVTAPHNIGDISFIRIWHDVSGAGSGGSWYLQGVVVYDLQTRERYHFECKDWLSPDRGDGATERLLSPMARDELSQWSRVFGQTSSQEMSDDHLWFSLFSRPTRSSFTRVERWSCCVSLLFLSMITSAMWYGRIEEDGSGQLLKLGPFVLSTKELYIATMSALICFPVNVIVIQLFRRSRRSSDKGVIRTRISGGLQREAQSNGSGLQEDISPYAEYLSDLYGDRGCPTPDPLTNTYFPPSSTGPNQPQHTTAPAPEEREGCRLPGACVYLAWILVFLSIGSSAFFIILYSVEWGPEKSEKWLAANFIGFFENVIFIQPIKVLVVTAILAMIFKEKLIGEDIKLTDGHLGTADTESIRQRTLRSQEKTTRLDCSSICSNKEKRQREASMERSMQQIILYTVYLVVITLVSYGQRDPQAFFVTQHITNALVTPKIYSLKAANLTGIGFSEVSTLEDFESWAQSTFLPNINPYTKYNGDPYTDWRELRLFTLGGNFYRVGKPRFRQLRVKGTKEELTQKHDPGWNTYTESQPADSPPTPWQYQTEDDLATQPIWGAMNVYGGGGYVHEHPSLLSSALKEQREMFTQGWIDKYTRAVVTEFSVYNAHANLLATTVLLMEMSSTGAITTWWDINVLSLYPYSGNFGLIRAISEVTFIVFLLYNTVTVIMSIWRRRKTHFNSFWAIWDMALLVLSWVSVAMYLARFFIVKDIMNRFSDNQGEKLEFFKFGYYDRLVTCMVAVLVFCSSVRMLCLLKHNSRVMLFLRILQISGSSLFDFGMMFLIVMIAFTSFAYGVFGVSMKSYATFVIAFESLLAAFVGARMFSSMETEASHFGRAFFLLFVCTMLFIMTNILISIISDGMEQAKKELEDHIKGREFVQFLGSRLKDFLGMDTRTTTTKSENIKGKPNHSTVGLQCDMKSEKNQHTEETHYQPLSCDNTGNFDGGALDNTNFPEMDMLDGTGLDMLWGRYKLGDAKGKMMTHKDYKM